MITDFKSKTAVLTGAGSGFGLEAARIGARLGMKLVLVDVQQDALDRAAAELQASGAEVLALQVDVSDAAQMEHLARRVQQRFGAPHFVFNNAGVPTGINQSERNRPGELSTAAPTRSQLIGRAMSDKAVNSGKVTAAEVAQKVFDAVATRQFYIYSHPKAIGSVQTRMEDILQARNPTDPFAHKPELGVELKRALRAE